MSHRLNAILSRCGTQKSQGRMKQMESLIETWESDVGVVMTPQHEVERAADVGEGSGEADLLDAENTEDNKSSEVRTEGELPDGGCH